jgi:hypothetical protein
LGCYYAAVVRCQPTKRCCAIPTLLALSEEEVETAAQSLACRLLSVAADSSHEPRCRLRCCESFAHAHHPHLTCIWPVGREASKPTVPMGCMVMTGSGAYGAEEGSVVGWPRRRFNEHRRPVPLQHPSAGKPRSVAEPGASWTSNGLTLSDDKILSPVPRLLDDFPIQHSQSPCALSTTDLSPTSDSDTQQRLSPPTESRMGAMAPKYRCLLN